jgi:hypothetical protein
MLLPDVVHPENSIYYNGAIVLNTLKNEPKQDILELFQKVKTQKDISFSVFILCLDWLYLLNIAKLNQVGKVELCF